MQNDDAERQKLYAETRSDLLKRQLSNSENFDRSVLSLSSALLVASIAFIRPSGPGAGTHHAGILAWSWAALALSIVSTMASFLVSQKAIDHQLELADKYYRQRQNDALTANNLPARWTLWLNLLAGAAFLAGVGLTVWFAILSIPTR
jgi:hypothetical protein